MKMTSIILIPSGLIPRVHTSAAKVMDMIKEKKTMVVAAILLLNFIFIGILLLNIRNPLSPAPDFTLSDVQGKTFSLSDYNGHIVILNFMKTQCAPCRMEVTELKKVYDKYNESAVIISISIDPTNDTNEQLLEFMDETGITWIVARGTNEVKSDYDVKIGPTIFIIDQSGYIRFKHTGLITEESLSKEIVKLP